MAAQNFDSIYQGILKSEGGLSTRNAASGDPGGRTMMGVTQGTYNSWRKMNGLPSQDVANISPDEHRTIFKTQYWDPIHGDELPNGLDYAAMDSAINSGPSRAVRLLQRTLGQDEDGIMGGDTLAALGGMDPSTALGQFTANRRTFQLNLSNAAQNPGWGPRIDRVNSDAAAAIRNGGFGGNTLPTPAPGSDLFGKGFDASGDAVAGNVGPNGAAPPYLGPGLSFPGGNDGFGAIGAPNFGAGITPYQPMTAPPFSSGGFNPFGGNALGGGQAVFSRGFPTIPLPPSFYAPSGDIQTPDPISGTFGMPQAQGVDPGNPIAQPAGLTADPNFGAPNMPGVNPNAGFNPGQFLGGGLGAFGGGYGSFNPFGGRGFGGLPAQPVSAFGAPGAVSTNGFDGTDAGTLGPTGVPTQAAPPAFNPFGSRGGIQAFGGGYGAMNANPLGFYGLNVPSLGFSGTDAATLGPGQSVTATDLAPAPAPAFNPFGSSRYGGFGAGLNLGAFGGAGNQSFGSFYGLPGLPPSADASTLGADQTAQTLGPEASANSFGFNGASASPLGFGGAQVMPFGGAFGGFNARTFGFGGANVPAFGFGGTSAPTLGFNGLDSPAIGPDQFATALAPATPAFNPFGGGGYGGFGGRFNPGGFGGVGAQSFGSLFGVPAAPAAPAAPAPNPFGFGGDVSGFDPNAGGAPAAPAPPSGSLGGDDLFGSSGFDPQASENAYLRGEMARNAAMQQAGQAPVASNPNLYPSLFAAIQPTQTNGTSYIASQPNFAPAPGFSAPVSYAAPQVSLMMAAPQISLPTMNFSGGGFGGLGGFL